MAFLPRPLLCSLLALAWLAAPLVGALHTVAVAHAVCAEHRVVEHGRHAEGHDDGRDGEDHDDGGDHDAEPDDHDACALIAATLGASHTVGTEMPPADSAAAAAPVSPLDAPSLRGPPILAYAAKTSPPTT